MAKLLGTVRKYAGKSWEEKPRIGGNQVTGLTITAADLPVGSTFLEEDTGDEYAFNGEEWELSPQSILTSRIVKRLDKGFAELLKESQGQTQLLKEILQDIPEEEGA